MHLLHETKTMIYSKQTRMKMKTLAKKIIMTLLEVNSIEVKDRITLKKEDRSIGELGSRSNSVKMLLMG